MPFASQLCSFPWYLYLYLQAHLLAHQQIIPERLRAQGSVRTSVSPLYANTTNTQNSINKFDQQNSTNNSQNCRNRTVEKKPRSGILSSAETQTSNRVVEKFSENLPSNNLNAKCNLLLKISHSQTLKLLNEYLRNLLLKIIRTTPQALNKCVRNRLLTIIRTTNFEQLFFKLLRNERISRCAIYFE